MTVKRVPLAERFWKFVDKTGDCWEWTGSLCSSGYGGVFIERGKSRATAHRVSYELENGEGSASGLYVCHHCDNKRCVRPSHLFLGTAKDNMDDMRRKGRERKPGPKNHARGEATGLSTLTASDVRWVRWARQYSGATYGTIAKHFGVNAQTPSNICNRVTWGHVK